MFRSFDAYEVTWVDWILLKKENFGVLIKFAFEIAFYFFQKWFLRLKSHNGFHTWFETCLASLSLQGQQRRTSGADGGWAQRADEEGKQPSAKDRTPRQLLPTQREGPQDLPGRRPFEGLGAGLRHADTTPGCLNCPAAAGEQPGFWTLTQQ